MRQLTSSEIRNLSLQQVEQEIASTYRHLTNAQVASHIRRGLLPSSHPEHQDGLQYAMAEARRRVGDTARAAEAAAWDAFEQRWGLQSDMDPALLEKKLDAVPLDAMPEGGSYFLQQALLAR